MLHIGGQVNIHLKHTHTLEKAIMQHICSSFTRYYAIVKPLKYPISMTKRVVGIMLLNTWISPALLSFLPIFIGWYTTEEHRLFVNEHPEQCAFVVNKYYAIISSSISFWIPCTIMIFTYLAIFREANRQEKQLMMRHGNAMLMHRPSMQPSGECEPEQRSFYSNGGSKSVTKPSAFIMLFSLPHTHHHQARRWVVRAHRKRWHCMRSSRSTRRQRTNI